MTVDAVEFEDLFRSTARSIHGYLSRRGAGADIDDLVAETYLIAWRRRADLPPAVDRAAWLHGIARRLLLAHYRQVASRPASALPEGVPAAAQDPEVAPDPDRARVLKAMDRLAEVDRELLTLTVWDGLTSREAALVCGLAPGTARVRLSRARRRLAACLEEDDPPSATLGASGIRIPATN